MIREQTALVLHPYGQIPRSLAQITKFSRQQWLRPNPRRPVNTNRTTPSVDSCHGNRVDVREVLTFCVSLKQEHSCSGSFRQREPCNNTIKPVHDLTGKLCTDAGKCEIMTDYQIDITATELILPAPGACRD